MTKPAVFEMSADTRLLRQALSRVAVGATISYESLSAEISKPVSGSFAALHSARDSLLRHDRIVFSVIRGEGLKRLDDREIISAGDEDVSAIRRKSRKALRKLTAIADYNALSPADQLRHTATVSIFAAVADMATDKGVKKVEATAQGRSGELPIALTLSAFATEKAAQ